MLANLEYVIAIDKHPGRYPNNGGEYGYSRRLWNMGNGKWEVEYRTTAEFDYCQKTGQFQDCPRCPDWRDGSCTLDWETVSDAEVTELIDRYPGGGDTDDNGRPYGIIDATGHERCPCRYDGGCIECYPCNHEGCSLKQNSR